MSQGMNRHSVLGQRRNGIAEEKETWAAALGEKQREAEYFYILDIWGFISIQLAKKLDELFAKLLLSNLKSVFHLRLAV